MIAVDHPDSVAASPKAVTGMEGNLAELTEVFSSVTEDPLLQVGAAAALLSAVSYSLLYKSSQVLSPKLCKGYKRLKRQDKIDWNTRLPSTLHALVVAGLCIWALCYSGDFFDNVSSSSNSYGSGGTGNSNRSLPVVMRVSELSYAIIGISFGYFVIDAAVMAAHPEIGSTEIYIHHAVALVSLAVAAQVHCMHVYLMMVLLSELTTPFVNLRWLLDKADLKGLKLYTVNGLLLLLVWGVARVVLFVPFYVHVLQNWDSVVQIPMHATVLLLGVPLLLFALNTMWFVKIVRGAYKLVFPKQQEHQQQQQQAGSANKLDAGRLEGSNAVEIMAYAGHRHVE